nr:hypothetical protein B0A51_15683 [Rachicladosporium sp. CCFEE 5018]
MAIDLPVALKSADCQRFATRAAQLEKFRPIVTYWCEYYILQIILTKQLHTSSEEVSNYAVHLMDKLEAYKSENAANDAVTDDIAAKAYVENFALETFARAETEQRGHVVKRQTADTFQAAATFLDLLSIWGALDVEAAAKSKFAKFHALRIARALKEGKDPNETNPKVEEPALPKEPDDEVEQELRDLEREGREATYRPPTVESAPDSHQASRAISASRGSPPLSLPTQPSDEPHAGGAQNRNMADVDAEDEPKSASRTASVGGGYFPSVPTGTSGDAHHGTAADAPSDTTSAAPSADPSDFYSLPPSAPALPVHSIPSPPPPQAPIQPPPQPYSQIPPRPAAPTPTATRPSALRTDDDSVMAAQKHAKWAISALNFEDVPTAVAELKRALESLGGL